MMPLFAEDSRIAGSYVILILAGLRTFESVPNVSNLREVVALQLGMEMPEETPEDDTTLDN